MSLLVFTLLYLLTDGTAYFYATDELAVSYKELNDVCPAVPSSRRFSASKVTARWYVVYYTNPIFWKADCFFAQLQNGLDRSITRILDYENKGKRYKILSECLPTKNEGIFRGRFLTKRKDIPSKSIEVYPITTSEILVLWECTMNPIHSSHDENVYILSKHKDIPEEDFEIILEKLRRLPVRIRPLLKTQSFDNCLEIIKNNIDNRTMSQYSEDSEDNEDETAITV